MMPEIINTRLLNDYYFLENQGLEVLGVFLFVSQNYCCDTSASDIDVKAIVVPSFDNLAMGKTEFSNCYQRENGELTVFDIRNMIYNYKKQNVNFLETLFTKWYIINDKYKSVFDQLIENRERIAHLNRYANIQCIAGCAKNKSKKVFKEMPSNKEAIQKYGFDNKALADIIRFRDMLHEYMFDTKYEFCLVPENNTYIRELKQTGYFTTVYNARKMHDNLMKQIDDMLKEADCTLELNKTDFEVVELLDTTCKDIIKLHLMEELKCQQ